jgi:TRAP-type C4-dicarboxylate transport system permease small subunit
MRQFLNGLAVMQEWLAAAGLLLITGLVVIAVIFRYWLQAPLAWAEEGSKLTLMFVVYFGTGAVAFRGQHLRADVFGESLPPAVLRIREIVVEALLAGMLGALAIQVALFANRIRPVGQVTAALEIPQWAIVGSFSIGMLLMVMSHVYRLVGHLRGETAASPPSADEIGEIPL